MARLIFNDRKKYTEHWEIAARQGTGISSITYNEGPHTRGYDAILNSKTVTMLVVHELIRLPAMFEYTKLTEVEKEGILQQIHGIYA